MDNQNFAAAPLIICVCENRSREVCISLMESKRRGAVLEVYVFADTHSYIETLSTIQTIAPDIILLHDGSRSSILAKKIEDEIKHYKEVGIDISIIYMARICFDQDRGANLLALVVVGNLDADLIAKYTVLAGCYCLLRYIEKSTGTTFAPKSVQFLLQSGDSDRMSIDRRTTVALELISSLRNGNQRESLFGFLNSTHTPAGAHLLRSNILRPLVEINTLNTRHEFILLLLNDSWAAGQCGKILEAMPDIDMMLTNLCKVSTNITHGINSILMLREVTVSSIALSEVIVGINDNNINDTEASSLINTIGEILVPFGSDGGQLLVLINEYLDSEAVYSKSNKTGKANVPHSECFALKNGISGPLDIARSSYLNSVESMNLLSAQYEHKIGNPIKVKWTINRGYYLQVQSIVDLPMEFVQVSD